ncbi:ABC transporter ATP-binding protein [Ruania suaedae]|uniref:ABC transporter ATP-binding protein n=1 Tax=Ruania suaedae TaxID=2897774 RepID=UPI001E4F50AA|nr:ABC transporter ATP-binding protein [Ruania suaedae]UFU03239.1 ABC transporter ATP-binding protein [Ruania suaedae]
MTSTPAIDVHDLNVRYGDFHAVKNLTFQVERGELYALLGTNGAGKTSTLEVMEGHRTASSGTITVLGENPGDRHALRPRTGIMLQESGFAPDLTVTETVALLGRLSGREDRVERVLEVVDLRHKASTRVSQLSGGEKRRLDFATALYGSPELIFLDEPTTGLDIASRDALWSVVDDLRRTGSTVILTTHYLEEAQQRADRIGLMHQGTFRHEGTVAELTRSLPAVIAFSLPTEAPSPPAQAARIGEASFQIESHELQRDLTALMDWARTHDVALEGLSAAPTRLDDVFRAIEPTA